MTCPFCGAAMQQVNKDNNDFFMCKGEGPLLTKESGPCPYAGAILTEIEIQRIATFLLDNDMGD